METNIKEEIRDYTVEKELFCSVNDIFFCKEQFLQKRQQTINIMMSICIDLERTSLDKSATEQMIKDFATFFKIIDIASSGKTGPKKGIVSDVILSSSSLLASFFYKEGYNIKDKISILGNSLVDEQEIRGNLKLAYQQLFSFLRENEKEELAISTLLLIDIVKETFELSGVNFWKVRENQPDLFFDQEYR